MRSSRWMARPGLLALVLGTGLALLLGTVLGGGCGGDGSPQVGDRPSRDEREQLGPGRWRRRAVSTELATSGEEREAFARLEAIGYVGGSQPGAGRSGVGVHDRVRASRGTNLYSDGHAPEAVLIDTEGRVLHRWSKSFAESFPETDRDLSLPGTQWWRHVELLPGGELLAIFGGQGLIKLDRDSRLLWANPVRAHHQLRVLDDGSLLVLTHEANDLPWFDAEEPVLEDFLTHMDADGRILSQQSLVVALWDSPFRDVLEDRTGNPADVLHCNSLQVLDGSLASIDPAFAAGNVLISSRNASAVFVVDPRQGRAVWARKGDFRTQHDAQLLASGNLLLFDNNGLPGESRILELDPIRFEPRWTYRGDEQAVFYSEWLGAVQRLPGGTTLITDSNSGRALEVTPAGEIVWEFHTPATAGESDEFIASMSRMARLSPEIPLDWLPEADGGYVPEPENPADRSSHERRKQP